MPDEVPRLPALSVIIPVKDDPPLPRAVASVLAAGRGRAGFELIVVNNGSSPEFAEVLRTLPPEVRVLDEPRPGISAARNRGIAESSGEYVLFTDADCVVAPDWIDEAYRGFAETGAEVVVGTWGAIESSPAAAWIEAALRSNRPHRAGLATRINGRNFGVRRAVFADLLFNEANFRAEDAEFTLEARARGYRVVLWPTMRLDHEHENTIVEFVAKRIVSGWDLRRLRVERPDLGSPYRSSKRALPLAGRALRAVPFRARLAGPGVAGVLRAARLCDRAGRRLPRALTVRLVRLLALLANNAGAFLYDCGYPPQRSAELLAGRLLKGGS
jgi:glycosyltransferase involved in cell wall biosynthesis